MKTLARDPAASSCLATSANLSTLLAFSTTFKDDHDALCEALRCVANTLLLIEDARLTFIGKDVNGGDACVSMLDVSTLRIPVSSVLSNCLQKATASDQIFILSRILFLSTVAGPPYLETLVDGKHNGRTIVDILGSKLDSLSYACRGGLPFAKEGLTDALKFSFNILMHYPKVCDPSTIQPISHVD